MGSDDYVRGKLQALEQVLWLAFLDMSPEVRDAIISYLNKHVLPEVEALDLPEQTRGFKDALTRLEMLGPISE